MGLLERVSREGRGSRHVWQTVMAIGDACDPGAAARLYALGVERVLIRGRVTPTDVCTLVDTLPVRPMAA